LPSEQHRREHAPERVQRQPIGQRRQLRLGQVLVGALDRLAERVRLRMGTRYGRTGTMYADVEESRATAQRLAESKD
jgi:hypothetical protein